MSKVVPWPIALLVGGATASFAVETVRIALAFATAHAGRLACVAVAAACHAIAAADVDVAANPNLAEKQQPMATSTSRSETPASKAVTVPIIIGAALPARKQPLKMAPIDYTAAELTDSVVSLDRAYEKIITPPPGDKPKGHGVVETHDVAELQRQDIIPTDLLPGDERWTPGFPGRA